LHKYNSRADIKNARWSPEPAGAGSRRFFAFIFDRERESEEAARGDDMPYNILTTVVLYGGIKWNRVALY